MVGGEFFLADTFDVGYSNFLEVEDAVEDAIFPDIHLKFEGEFEEEVKYCEAAEDWRHVG